SCLCLAKLVQNHSANQTVAFATGVVQHIVNACYDEVPQVRAAAAYALANVFGGKTPNTSAGPASAREEHRPNYLDGRAEEMRSKATVPESAGTFEGSSPAHGDVLHSVPPSSSSASSTSAGSSA